MSRWTKATYESVARMFRECRDELEQHSFQSETVRAAGVDTVDSMAHRMADAFEDDNPRFDRARFLDACGVVDPAQV